MPIPAGVETVTVSSGEPLTLPDGTLVKGHIRFVAPTLNVIGADDYVFGGESVAELVDGEFSIVLVAPDATGINPTDWTYTIIGEFTNANDWTTFISITKDSPDVKLADVIEPVSGDANFFATFFLPLTGGTMTGSIVLPGNPTTNLQAAPKQYVDSTAAAAQAAAEAAAAAESVSLAGDTMTGPLVLSADPSAALGAATKQYVENYVTDTVGLDTGVLSGGELNANVGSPLSLDISDTVGIIVDYVTDPLNPAITRVNFSAQTVALTDTVEPLTWWMLDDSGTVVQQTTKPTNSQRRTHIQLGVTAQDGIEIFVDQSVPSILPQPLNQLYDLMEALGNFNIAGNQISPVGANLQLSRSGGTCFTRGFNHFAGPTLTNDPHVSTVSAQNPVVMRYVTQIPAAAVPTVTVVDPTRYDVGGTITLIGGGAGSSTIQRVWLFPTNDANDQIVIQYGQAVYSSLDAAVAAVGNQSYVKNPGLVDGILIGYVIATRTATNLSVSTQARIISAARFSENAAGASAALSLALLLTGGTMTGTINASLATAATVALASLVTGDTFDRFRRYADGLIEWGPGNAGRDTNMYRAGASLLKTDDKFVAALGLGVGNSAAATTPGTIVRRIEVFDAAGVSLGFVPVYDSIT